MLEIINYKTHFESKFNLWSQNFPILHQLVIIVSVNKDNENTLKNPIKPAFKIMQMKKIIFFKLVQKVNIFI